MEAGVLHEEKSIDRDIKVSGIPAEDKHTVSIFPPLTSE